MCAAMVAERAEAPAAAKAASSQPVVVVEGLRGGAQMLGVITETDKTLRLKAEEDIPIGHKVALKALKKGDTVIKYGEDIGRMIADAGAGTHVHVQNLKTKRW